MPVQIVYECGHTSESYVSEEAWRKASILRCPICRADIDRHGTYERKIPYGIKVARFYCRPCGLTVSLLPDFLAAGYIDTLVESTAALPTCL